MTDIESLCRLTEAVEAAGADIAPTYLEYVQLSFAIATDYGEAGREFFHRLCRVSPKYQREHAERVFSNALHTQRGEVHLGTAFHLAEATGVSICIEEMPKHPTGTKRYSRYSTQISPHTGAYNKVGNDNISEEREGEEELLPGSEPQHQLPTFPKKQLAGILATYHKSREQPNTTRHHVIGSAHCPGCLYVAPRAMPIWRQIPSPQPPMFRSGSFGFRQRYPFLHPLTRGTYPRRDPQRSDHTDESIQKEKAEYDAMGKERTKKEAPQMPPNRMFLISGNNTGTGILQNIMDSDGTGLICEAEADTLSTAIGSDHGHWSDTLRKAFDHDRLSYNRRTDQEYREVKKSYLSVLISGTPSQVQTFIPTAEDGSYSRQLYYYMCGISKWISQFMDNEIDWEEIFTAMGLEWKEKLSVIKSHGIHTLQLTDEQKKKSTPSFPTCLNAPV